MKGQHHLVFFSIANVSGFRCFDTASFRMLYIHWIGFLAGGSHVLLLCDFQQFYQFLIFFFPTFRKYNFLPLNNFSKIEVIFRFIEVWWRKLQCSTFIFLNSVSFLFPDVWRKKLWYPVPGRNSKIPQSKIFIYSILLEQLEFLIFLVLHFQKGLLQNLEWRVNVACTLGRMQSPLLFEILSVT